jgi:hypothetical protein
MKKNFILSLLLLSNVLAFAQFKQVAAGPSFDEPEKGMSKMVLMKDGSVFFFNITNKDGINIRLYNPAHKETVATTLEPAYGQLKSPGLEGSFEINGNLVLLISEVQDKVPVLYRLIIDGKTSKLTREEKIGELKKVTFGMGYAVAFGGVDLPDFYVSKDPESDNYALVLFNSFESDRSKRIEIILYGSDHKELSRAYYSSPEEKYKYLQFVSMAVIGSDKVSVLVNGYNSGGKDREVILATLNKGATVVTFNELNFPQDSILENGLVRYNPYIKKLVVAAKIHARKNSKEAGVYFAIVDPEKGKAEKVIQSGLGAEVNERAANIFGKKYKFWGIPKNLYINNDGGWSVTYEEVAVVSASYSSGGGSSHVETYNIAVVTYDKTGNMLSSYLIPKNFWIDNASSLSYGGGFGNQYKRFAYINGANKSYILINDTRRNIEKLEKDKDPVQIQGVGDCDAFYFPLTGKDPIPARKYLFGESEDKKERNLAPFGISEYDKANDVFIVMRLNKEGRNKMVNLVWLKPE